MRRENRYYVLKRKDIEQYLSSHDQLILNRIARDIQIARTCDGRNPDMDCVVVEKDWPEYEPTWEMIERRVDDNEKTS